VAVHFYEISLYKVGLLTAVASWFLYKSGGTNRLPRFEMMGTEGGFFVVHGLIFLSIWFIIYFFERNFGVPRLFRSIRSRQGTALWLDVVAILTTVVCLIFSFGFGTLSTYQIGGALVLSTAAAQSIMIGREFQLLLGPIFPGSALPRTSKSSPAIATQPDAGVALTSPQLATSPSERPGSVAAPPAPFLPPPPTSAEATPPQVQGVDLPASHQPDEQN